MSIVGTVLILGVIAGLFYLDKTPGHRTSPALWIPTLWIMAISSRPLSAWLNFHSDLTQSAQFMEGSPLDAGFYAVLIVLAALTLNRRWPTVKQHLMGNLPILLYFFYCALSLMWSDFPAVAAKRWIKAIGDVMMILVVLTDPDPRLAIKRIFTRNGFILLPLSFLFIYFIPSMGTSWDPVAHILYYNGVTLFKNLLGVTCLIVGTAELAAFLEAYEDKTLLNRTRHMAAHGLTFLMAVVLVRRADAMTSFSALMLASAVMGMAMTRWARQRRGAIFGLVASAVGIALVALFSATVLLTYLGRNSSLTGRTQIWAAVLAQHTNPFIGTGYESFWLGDRLLNVGTLSQQGISEAHDGYLEIYINLGWIGLVLLGGLIVTGYRNAAAVFRQDPPAGRLRLGLYTASMVYVFTEAGFRMMSPDWLAFLFAIVAVPPVLALAQHGMPARALHGPPPRRTKILQ